MNPRVIKVIPQEGYSLLLTFSNDEVKKFDMKPYLAFGDFKELNDLKIFNSVKPFLGSVQWNNELDLCVDTLYSEGVLIVE